MRKLRSPKIAQDVGNYMPDRPGYMMDPLDLRPGMRVTCWEQVPDSQQMVTGTARAVDATLRDGWHLVVRIETVAGVAPLLLTLPGDVLVFRELAEVRQPTEVGAVVELDQWADGKRFIYGGTPRGWIDSDGTTWDWLEVTSQGQVHVVVPSLAAIQEAM